ncbi:hypothetical protein H5T87_01360 [bacterium]|nr:hypothetical protein [bacterium]
MARIPLNFVLIAVVDRAYAVYATANMLAIQQQSVIPIGVFASGVVVT